MIALLDQAANLGSAGAEYELGVVDEHRQNTKKAKNQTEEPNHGLCRQVADQGPGRAEFKLGKMPASQPAAVGFRLNRAMNPLVSDPLVKATVLHCVASAKLKAADKAQVTFNR
jgi:hypothetical protein